MKPVTEALIEQALQLPADERRQIVDALDASLDPVEEVETDLDVLAAWDAEIQKRIQEIDDGTVETFDGDEVMAELRAWQAAQRATQQR